MRRVGSAIPAYPAKITSTCQNGAGINQTTQQTEIRAA
jgi:hypothetical protein